DDDARDHRLGRAPERLLHRRVGAPGRLTMRRLLAALLLTAAVAPLARAATVTVLNLDGPSEGFNDPSPVAPIGGNNGVTLGQQRLLAFPHAADLSGAVLQSNIPIPVDPPVAQHP